MNRMERAALGHVAEWKAYERSGQAERDRVADIARREALDKSRGHVPGCGLLRCAPGCKSNLANPKGGPK